MSHCTTNGRKINLVIELCKAKLDLNKITNIVVGVVSRGIVFFRRIQLVLKAIKEIVTAFPRLKRATVLVG